MLAHRRSAPLPPADSGQLPPDARSPDRNSSAHPLRPARTLPEKSGAKENSRSSPSTLAQQLLRRDSPPPSAVLSAAYARRGAGESWGERSLSPAVPPPLCESCPAPSPG